jgi:hypothetical protein
LVLLAPVTVIIFLTDTLLDTAWITGTTNAAILVLPAWHFRSAYRPLWSNSVVFRAEKETLFVNQLRSPTFSHAATAGHAIRAFIGFEQFIAFRTFGLPNRFEKDVLRRADSERYPAAVSPRR